MSPYPMDGQASEIQEARIREIVREEVAAILASAARSGRKQEIPISKRSWDQGFGVPLQDPKAPGCAWHGTHCPDSQKSHHPKGGPC